MSEEGEVSASMQVTDSAPAPPVAAPGSDENMEGSEQQQQQSVGGAGGGGGGEGSGRPRGERMVKVLLTSMQAGALIGQGGSAVNELQKKTNTRIRVSNKTMTFPSTQLRIISVEGADEALKEAMKTIVEVCFHEQKNEVDPTGEMILALPSAAAPLIIGKQGAKVAELVKQTGCEIRLARQSDEVPGVKERLATLKGKREKILEGAYGILDVIFADQSGRASTYDNRTTNYESRRGDDYGRRSYRDDDRYDSRHGRDSRDDYRGGPSRDSYRDPRFDRGGYPGSMDRNAPFPPRDPYYRGGPPPSSGYPPRVGAPPGYPDDDRRGGGLGPVPLVQKPGHNIQVSVPDEFVGAMLGRAGENLAEIQRATRTRITVSQRGEYVPDTRDRIVTISGAPQDCEIAKTMLAEKITKPATL